MGTRTLDCELWCGVLEKSINTPSGSLNIDLPNEQARCCYMRLFILIICYCRTTHPVIYTGITLRVAEKTVLYE